MFKNSISPPDLGIFKICIACFFLISTSKKILIEHRYFTKKNETIDIRV